jgi:hypothetical protein
MRIFTHPAAGLLALILCAPAVASDTQGFTHYEESVIREYFRRQAEQFLPGEWEKTEKEAEEALEREPESKDEAEEERGLEREAEDRSRGARGRRAKGPRGKGKSEELPPGLAKKDELPPGLAKQLRERGTLPPGLAKRDLPEDLEAKLPEPESEQERVIVDDDVVLIDKETRTVIDIIEDVAKAVNQD